MYNSSGVKIKEEPRYGADFMLDMPQLESVAGRAADHRTRAPEGLQKWGDKEGAADHRARAPEGLQKWGDKEGAAATTSSTLLLPPPASAASVKTPKYTGSSDWEAFHAQFELLAVARRWGSADKALQLALCLEGDALSCLLLLDPAQRQCYDDLVGALKRRFGTWSQPALLKNELRGRCRKPGESLRGLANDIEGQVRRAYSHMPADARSELATDLFVGAISPPDLRVQVQLQHPKSLQEALEAAIERESLQSAAAGGGQGAGSHAVRATSGCPAREEVPAWAAEMTELLRAVTLQGPRGPRPGPQVCWGCGQPGHILRECPAARQTGGNSSGSA